MVRPRVKREGVLPSFVPPPLWCPSILLHDFTVRCTRNNKRHTVNRQQNPTKGNLRSRIGRREDRRKTATRRRRKDYGGAFPFRLVRDGKARKSCVVFHTTRLEPEAYVCRPKTKGETVTRRPAMRRTEGDGVLSEGLRQNAPTTFTLNEYQQAPGRDTDFTTSTSYLRPNKGNHVFLPTSYVSGFMRSFILRLDSRVTREMPV